VALHRGHELTWDAIAAVGELLGAVGVIASLVYVARQVRSSGYQARQAAVQSVVNKMNDVWNVMASGGTADLWARGSRGLGNLEGESEKIQYSALLLSLLRPYEELFYYRADGQIEDWTWESVSSVCHSVIGTRGFEEWWELRAAWFSNDFQKHVREVLGTRPEYRRFEAVEGAS